MVLITLGVDIEDVVGAVVAKVADCFVLIDDLSARLTLRSSISSIFEIDLPSRFTALQ